MEQTSCKQFLPARALQKGVGVPNAEIQTLAWAMSFFLGKAWLSHTILKYGAQRGCLSLYFRAVTRVRRDRRKTAKAQVLRDRRWMTRRVLIKPSQEHSTNSPCRNRMSIRPYVQPERPWSASTAEP